MISKDRSSAAISAVDQVSLLGSGVELPWPCDLLVTVEETFLPLGKPSRRAPDREQHREHLHWEAHRLVDEPRVEVDVRVELVLDEVLVFERDLLELERDVQQRVAARDAEHLVGDLLDDLRARVVALVDAVAEAHEAELTALHALDVLRHAVERADVLEHAQHLLV